MSMSNDSKIYKHYEDCHNACNQKHSYLLGRVLTVVDAAIADPVQRKAVKDLMKVEFEVAWVDGFRDILAKTFQHAASEVGDSFGRNICNSGNNVGGDCEENSAPIPIIQEKPDPIKKGL